MTSVRCPECNLANWATSINCKRCGYFLQPSDTENVSPDTSPFGAEQNPPQQFPDANSQNFQTSERRQADNQSNWSQTAPPNNQNYRQPNYQNSYQPHYAQNNNYSGNQAGYGQNRYVAPERKSGMAIASMVLGLIGCFLASPVGLILGIVSLKRANRSPFEYGGKGFAIAGIVLNVVGCFTLPIIAAIAIPNLLASRRTANEGNAIYTVRQLADAEETYRTAGIGNRCGDLQKLQAANLIDPTLAAGQKSGYRFLIVSLPTVGGGCEINAAPLTASHGTRSFFYSTEDDTLRAANKNGHFATQEDAPLNRER